MWTFISTIVALVVAWSFYYFYPERDIGYQMLATITCLAIFFAGLGKDLFSIHQQC